MEDQSSGFHVRVATSAHSLDSCMYEEENNETTHTRANQSVNYSPVVKNPQSNSLETSDTNPIIPFCTPLPQFTHPGTPVGEQQSQEGNGVRPMDSLLPFSAPTTPTLIKGTTKRGFSHDKKLEDLSRLKSNRSCSYPSNMPVPPNALNISLNHSCYSEATIIDKGPDWNESSVSGSSATHNATTDRSSCAGDTSTVQDQVLTVGDMGDSSARASEGHSGERGDMDPNRITCQRQREEYRQALHYTQKANGGLSLKEVLAQSAKENFNDDDEC
ncbi:hypothetical protein AGDE_15857 [Angomonas deanei]|uniref:Uncharacterized protein n=1 Tax=Angomonas deanei TaxID=59799 RepID=A0A7G2C9I6_9TRYP|nr:hypothetical protein AGDE_15857 [Angomonas deanei]CAD2216229.1 hypothetical protein, conserved [Angomonas deanei]|eukprot:EPY18261.1 hypothetical protein AGDE_15857 [Angomonas deanei]